MKSTWSYMPPKAAGARHATCCECCCRTTSWWGPSARRQCAQLIIKVAACSTGSPLSSDHSGFLPLRQRFLVGPEVKLNAQGQYAQAKALIDIWALTFMPLTLTASSRSEKCFLLTPGFSRFTYRWRQLKWVCRLSPRPAIKIQLWGTCLCTSCVITELMRRPDSSRSCGSGTAPTTGSRLPATLRGRSPCFCISCVACPLHGTQQPDSCMRRTSCSAACHPQARVQWLSTLQQAVAPSTPTLRGRGPRLCTSCVAQASCRVCTNGLSPEEDEVLSSWFA